MEWLHHVPDVVWAALSGAVVASGISLFTTILSNRNSRKKNGRRASGCSHIVPSRTRNADR
jgi:hypothetical protein